MTDNDRATLSRILSTYGAAPVIEALARLSEANARDLSRVSDDLRRRWVRVSHALYDAHTIARRELSTT